MGNIKPAQYCALCSTLVSAVFTPEKLLNALNSTSLATMLMLLAADHYVFRDSNSVF